MCNKSPHDFFHPGKVPWGLKVEKKYIEVKEDEEISHIEHPDLASLPKGSVHTVESVDVKRYNGKEKCIVKLKDVGSYELCQNEMSHIATLGAGSKFVIDKIKTDRKTKKSCFIE